MELDTVSQMHANLKEIKMTELRSESNKNSYAIVSDKQQASALSDVPLLWQASALSEVSEVPLPCVTEVLSECHADQMWTDFP